MRRLFLIAALFLWTPAGAQNDDATPRKIEKETFVYAVRDADTLRLDPLCAPLARQPGETLPDVPFRRRLYDRNAGQPAFPPLLRLLRPQGVRRRVDRLPAGEKRARQAGLLDEEHFTQALDMTLSMATEDLYDATAYICRHMPDVDPSRIVTCGSSAGPSRC